jgi:hypothetical protein
VSLQTECAEKDAELNSEAENRTLAAKKREV